MDSIQTVSTQRPPPRHGILLREASSGACVTSRSGSSYYVDVFKKAPRDAGNGQD